MRSTSPLHAVTWLLWAVAAAASVQLAPSPVYVALVIVVCALVFEAHKLHGTLSRAFPLLVSLGVAFALVRVVLTSVTTHTGLPGVTWFTLPEATLPKLLGGFTVGGGIEGPVVLQAASEGLAIVGILAAFGAFNAVASHHELLQSAPKAFHEPGLIVTVALAFVPSTMLAVSAAREADRARTGGRVVRRGRLVRLAVPIVESGLERAIALSESMDARGFARLPPGRSDRAAGWLGLGSMLALGGSFVALVGRASAWALVAAVVGTVGLGASVLVASRGARTSRYRPRSVARLDVVVGALVLAAPLGLAVLGALDVGGPLAWSTYPVRFPSFSAAPALCVALLAAPVVVAPRRDVDRGAGSNAHEAPAAASAAAVVGAP
jgi:energy-coupling factor transport system permease protein